MSDFQALQTSTRGLAVGLLLALAVGCDREPGTTAGADRAHSSGTGTARGCTQASGADARRPEAIAPLAPGGEPANSFPKPARAVADIVSSSWSNEGSRDSAGEATEVMTFLAIRPGMSIADIGAGSGYYTVRLARRVGPAGRVIAEDIVPRYLKALCNRLRRERLTNVVLALGEPHDPRLPPESVDLALLVHMYHEIEQPFGLLYNLAPALRRGARVAVIDVDRSTAAHGTPPAVLRCELAAAGYSEESFRQLTGGGGYIAVFRPPAQRAEPTVLREEKPCASPRGQRR